MDKPLTPVRLIHVRIVRPGEGAKKAEKKPAQPEKK
jgi:hypothetical protein